MVNYLRRSGLGEVFKSDMIWVRAFRSVFACDCFMSSGAFSLGVSYVMEVSIFLPVIVWLMNSSSFTFEASAAPTLFTFVLSKSFCIL